MLASTHARRRALLAVSLGALALLVADPSSAQKGGKKKSHKTVEAAPEAPAVDPKVLAAEHLEKGRALMKDKSYSEAEAEFKASVQADPTETNMYEMAQCLMAQHRYPEALEVLKSMETTFQATMDSAAAEKVKKDIDLIENDLVEVEVTASESTAVVSVDGVPVSGKKLSLPAGTHTFAATLEGFHTTEREILLFPKSRKYVRLTLYDAKGPPPPPPGTIATAGAVAAASGGTAAAVSSSAVESAGGPKTFAVGLTFGLGIATITGDGWTEYMGIGSGDKKARFSFCGTGYFVYYFTPMIGLQAGLGFIGKGVRGKGEIAGTDFELKEKINYMEIPIALRLNVEYFQAAVGLAMDIALTGETKTDADDHVTTRTWNDDNWKYFHRFNLAPWIFAGAAIPAGPISVVPGISWSIHLINDLNKEEIHKDSGIEEDHLKAHAMNFMFHVGAEFGF
jgi:hypothetical protein